MKKPYEKQNSYYIMKAWCDATVRSLFSSIRSVGKDNIPADGAVLLAPNHCNTLMDALVVLQDWKPATLFGARADIFRKPLLNKTLRFLRILPIPRVRDGIQEVLHNRETMDEVIDALDHGMKYCMFCEGTHRPRHSLLPLKKGIVRTALLAHERLGDRKPVYIVPMGLEYQDYYRLQTSLAIRYGEAINVSAFVASHPEMGDAEVYRKILGELKERMSTLITYLPDDGQYDGRWALTKIAGRPAAMAAGTELVEEAAAFDRQRKERQLSFWSFGYKRQVLCAVLKLLSGLVLLPVFLFDAVVAAPMWGLSAYLVRGLKDKAFTRTALFGVKFLMNPLVVPAWSLVFFLCLPFPLALPAFLLLLFAHKFFYGMLNEGRIFLSDLRLLFGHKDLKARYARLATQAQALKDSIPND